MKIAVLSDIHGNIEAFNAVLADAESRGISQFILLGDYTGLGHTQKTVQLLRKLSLNPANVLISGNQEGYLIPPFTKEETTLLQFAPVRYERSTVFPQDYRFLTEMPATSSIALKDTTLYLSHSPADHFGSSIINDFGGEGFISLAEDHGISHTNYSSFVLQTIQQEKSFLLSLQTYPDGIYLFGHYHTQWHAYAGNKLLVNPGACGMPCDFVPEAPYTILQHQNNRWTVEEVRVPYNIAKMIVNVGDKMQEKGN